MTKNASPEVRRCVVHFGMHKTGSSSIQASLFRKALGGQFRYLDLGVDNPTGPLLNIFQAPEARYNDILRRGARLGYDAFLGEREARLVRLAAELSQDGGQTLIISAEGLNVLSEMELAGFRKFLGQHVDTIEAFAYVRPPKGFMESMFQQLVKGQLGRFDLHKLYPAYRERFEKFDHVFGSDNVHFRLFDPRVFPEGCVVQDFCQRFGVHLAKKEIVRVNEGLSRSAVAFLYVYRKYARDFDTDRYTIRANRRLVEEFGKLGGGKLLFSQDVVDAVLEENAADLCWMEARLGASLREKSTPQDLDSIRDETDLLRFDPKALHWLRERIERADIGDTKVDDDFADARRGGDSRPAVRVSPGILVRMARKTAPGSIDGISNAEAVSVVEEVFSVLGRELAAGSTGDVTVPSLGRFRAHESVRVVDGQEQVRRQISFWPMSSAEAVAQRVHELLVRLSRDAHAARPGRRRDAAARN